MIIDTHCHLNFSAFKHDYKKIIESNLNDEVWMIIIGTNKKTSSLAVELSRLTQKGVYATIGLHPVHVTKQAINEGGVEFTSTGEKFHKGFYKHLIKKSGHYKKFLGFLRKKTFPGKVVAIGETGLDYHYGKTKKVRKIQEKVFVNHLHLADSLNLPVIIHARGEDSNRNAVYDDLIHILEKERMRFRAGMRGVVHSFNGTYQQAQQLIKMGLLIGVNTSVKYDKALQGIVKRLRTQDILLETDAPYFHPSGDSTRRNEPKNARIVAENVARLQNKSIYEIESQTTQNAMHLFNIL